MILLKSLWIQARESQIAYARLYLERAKQVLVETGEIYKPSKAEQKADIQRKPSFY